LRSRRRDRSNLTDSSTRNHGRSTRGTSEAKKEGVRDLADRRDERLPPNKLGVVVPTGFEPVFQSRPCVRLVFHNVR